MNIKYMKEAYKEALKAFAIDEVAVGAVIVKNNKIIARSNNLKEKKACGIYHAEILAIIKACKKISNWRLDGCDIYITLAPCPMCASAIKQARISNVYCGLSNLNESTMNITKKIFEENDINSSVNFVSDLFCDEVDLLMKNFFKNKRTKIK